MRTHHILAILLVAGCYAPEPAVGSPCGICPDPLVCSPQTMRCERSSSCQPAPEICGDGIDQDCDGSDSACPPNDRPDGAIDVTQGGMFTVDLSSAHSDESVSCGITGGRDVFYKITLTTPQVYYLATYGSDFDSVVEIVPGECGDADGSGQVACADDTCSTPQTELAMSLPVGVSCIVVAQKSPSETTGALRLEVIPGGRDGTPLPYGQHSAGGDTCGGIDASQATTALCQGSTTAGKDAGYYFTACPGQTLELDASTCDSATTFDTQLYVLQVGTGPIACKDDETSATCPVYPDASILTNVTLANGVLYWVVVDGYALADCGTYALHTNLR